MISTNKTPQIVAISNLKPNNNIKNLTQTKDEFISNDNYLDRLEYILENYTIDEEKDIPLYKKNIIEKLPVLKQNSFTLNDYNNLTKKEKEIFKKIINKKIKNTTIKKDAEYVLKIAKNIKKT